MNSSESSEGIAEKPQQDEKMDCRRIADMDEKAFLNSFKDFLGKSSSIEGSNSNSSEENHEKLHKEDVTYENMGEISHELQLLIQQVNGDLFDLKVAIASDCANLVTQCGPDMDRESASLILGCKSCSEYLAKLKAEIQTNEELFQANDILLNDCEVDM